jgi:hypothetical protein
VPLVFSKLIIAKIPDPKGDRRLDIEKNTSFCSGL